MKKSIFALLALLLAASPVAAQWQTPQYSVPVGRGAGNTGFDNSAPGVAGQPYVSTGPASKPAFGTIGNAGFTSGPANTAKGSLNGTTTVDIPLPPCTAVSSAYRYDAGVGFNCGAVSTLTGYDMPINMGLSSSAVGGALTISLTTAAGAIPTPSSPVLVPFRSLVTSSGGVTWETASASTSVVIPSGATLGTANGVPFRVWIFLNANGGTPAVGVATCSNTSTVFPCASWESTLKTSTTISSGATSGGVLYATSGVSLDAVRIVGYCDFSAGLVTAGTWASACTTVQVFGPGIKKPGDVVQSSYAISNTSTAVSGSGVAVAPTASISPTSAMNLVRVQSDASYNITAAGSFSCRMARSAGAVPVGNLFFMQAAGGGSLSGHMNAVDAPGVISSVTYQAYCTSSGSSGTYNSLGSTTMELIEIMG